MSERVTLHPTPDPGERLTGELAWDEASRPTLGEPAGTTYTPAQQASAHHLVDVHDHLRAELVRVRDLVDQVRRGRVDAAGARSVVASMTMRQNGWTLGAYCASYCRVLTTHHTLEDVGVFPHLRRAEPAVGVVLDRLEHEHEVVAQVLDDLDRALVALVDDGVEHGEAALERLAAQVDLLTDTLLSHLAYEERELLGPLARHGMG